MEHDIVKRLAWSGMLAATSAVVSIVATRIAAFVFRRVFEEEPPE